MTFIAAKVHSVSQLWLCIYFQHNISYTYKSYRFEKTKPTVAVPENSLRIKVTWFNRSIHHTLSFNHLVPDLISLLSFNGFCKMQTEMKVVI